MAMAGNRKRGIKREAQRSDFLLGDNTPFQIAEAYKTVRTNLLYTTAATGNRVVVVSSASPSDGKSTTCANLAVALAQTGARVMLIDADLRKPVQNKIFKANNTQGLSRVLVGFSKLEECVKAGVSPNLDLLTAGPTPPNPAELLGSANMVELLEYLKTAYDYILIDTPPINVVTDALVLLNKHTDILLVGRQRQTTYDELRKASDSIRFTNATLLGVVVTSVQQEAKMIGTRSYKAYDYEYKKS